MKQSRISGRRVLLAIAALGLALGGIVVVGRLPRATPKASSLEGPAARPASASGSTATQGLRMERHAAGQKLTADPRASATPEAPTTARNAKSVVPLEDSPAARETVSPERRAPKAAKNQVLLGREELLKERDGVYGFSSRAYAATIGKGGVEFALPLNVKGAGQPSLSYQFVDLRVGGAVLATGGEATARALPAERTVSFDRGVVEERYSLRSDALEQSFVVRELPRGRGELTVTGRVTSSLGAPREGSSGSKLSFSAHGHDLLTISEAVAIDAAGRRQELELAYADGKISMTVPASWVASAALPITIDPLMSGPLTIDPSVTATIGQVSGVPVRITDVAYNGQNNEWLVVWQEQFGASAFNFDVYAQRVNAAGNLMGSVIPVGVTGEGEYEPAVSWASGVNRYLIAWRHDPADNASDADQIIAGRVLNADGTFFGSTFVLDDVAGQDFGPTLACDGTQWFCVFTNVVSATDTNVIGRFVSNAGVPGTVVNIDTEADLAAAPSVDLVGSTYLIAWQKGTSGGANSIVARTMDASGSLLTAITAVDQTTSDCSGPDVSAGGGQFLVVWQQSASATDRNVVGRRVTTSLTFSGNALNIRTSAADQLAPRASFSTTNSFWYVVYSDTTNASADIYGNRVDTTGHVFGANRITNVAVDEVKPELAWNSSTNEMLAVYLYGAASPYEIRAQRISMDFADPSIPGTPAAAPNPSGTGSFTLTWTPSLETGGSGFSNYDLQRSANGGATWAIIASPTSETYVDTMPQGEYVYRVRASDLAGNNSAYSPVSGVVTVDNASPPEPLAAQQFRADGVTPIALGQSTPDSSVVLSASIYDLGLLDGFEDSNFTLDPMWTVVSGSWGISTDGNKVLHDGSGLDDQIYTPSTQTTGSWEYRFRFATIATGSTVNLQSSFYPFLDSLGLGGNGYQVLVTAGVASTKTISLYRRDGAAQTRLIGANTNWTPDTNFHVVRINRSSTGSFDLMLDGVLVGSAVDATYGTAASTVIHRVTTNGNTLRVDFVRASSSPIARSTVKLQVEAKPVGTSFDGAGLVESALVAGGSVASVPVPVAVGSYHWRARVMDALGNAGAFVSFGGNTESDIDFTRIPASPPPPPSGLVASPGNAQATLSWGASSGATSYSVKRSLTHGTGYVTVASGLTALTAVDTGLQNGTTYYYVVTAVGAGGESAPSNEASVTPAGAPDAPTGLTTTAGSAQVLLTWTASPTAATYVVQRSTQSGTGYAVIASAVVPTSYTDNTAVNNTTYYYVILAVNAAGTSGPSNEASATPQPPPAAPANFVGVALSAGSIQWSWNDVSGETGYRLHDDAHNTIATNLADVTALTEAGLLENTSYSRHVHSVRGTAVSGASNSAAKYTLVHNALAADFVLTRAALTEIDVAVTPPPGAAVGNTGVQIERSTDGILWSVVKPYSKVYFHRDLGLSATASYSYRIRFQNADAVPSQVSPASTAPSAQAPATPTGLTGVPLGMSLMQWTWNPVVDATGYELHDDSHALIAVEGPSVGTGTEGGLSENSRASRHLHATNPVGASVASPAVAAYTKVHEPLAGDIAATGISSSSIQITVVAPPNGTSGQTGCEIQRSTDGGWVTVRPFSNTYTFTDGGLSESTGYLYRVRFRNGDGLTTQFSLSQSGATTAAAIARPLNFSGTAVSASSITWTWTDVSGETGFVLHDEFETVMGTVGTGVLSFTETGLLENKACIRHVHALKGTDMSQPSTSLIRYTLIHDATAADFTATVTSMSSVDLSATAPTGPTAGNTGIRIERSLDGTIWSLVANLKGIYLASDTGLRGSTAYQYRIRYLNGDGIASGLSSAKSVTTDTATVAPVTGLAATGGTGQISLTWNANTEPVLSGYNVYRAGVSGGPYSRLNGAPVTGTTFVDSTVVGATTYFYVVRAVDSAAHEGGNSNEASAAGTPPPNAPFFSSGSGLSATSISWGFEPLSGNASYLLHDSNHQLMGSTGVIFGFPEDFRSITETGLAENTSYARHLHSVTAAGTSEASNTVTGATVVHTPTTADFSLSGISGTSILVTVTPPPNPTSGSTGVRIQRSLNNSTWQTIFTVAGTYSFTDTGLSARTQYYYRIQFSNSSGSLTSASPSQSLITPISVPAGFGGVAQSTGTILWSWGSVNGATGYLLHDGAHNLIPGSALTGLTYSETGLQENVSYPRHVHSQDAVGPSDPSPAAPVYTLIHDPLAADFVATKLSATSARIVAVPPPGPFSGQTGCEIQRFDGASWTVIQPFTGSYSFVDTTLASGASYSYRIRFRNGDGVPTSPSPSKDVTGEAPPTAPTGFAGVAQSPSSILWTWDNFVGGTGFELHDDQHQVRGTIAANVLSYVESGLPENALVSRHLHATGAGGLSGSSTTIVRTTLVHDALTADFNLTVVAGDRIDVLVFPPPNGSDRSTACLIERSIDGTTWSVVKSYSNVYSYRDTTVTPSSTYSYRIQFRNGDGVAGLYSPSASATTPSFRLPIITTSSKKTRNVNTNVSGTADAGTTVSVYFNGILDGTATSSGTTWSYNATTKAEGTYAVTARASQGAVQSGFSDPITIEIDVTPPAPPTGIRVIPYNNIVDVLWEASPSMDVAGYLIYRKEGTADWELLNPSQVLIGKRYRDATVLNGHRYTYKVVAADNARTD